MLRWSQKLHICGQPACGINIERLVCFIAHQLYSLFGGGLLGFLFGLPASAAYDLSVEQHVREKRLVVRRLLVFGDVVGDVLLGVLLDYLLEYRLLVAELYLARLQRFDTRHER